MFLKISGSTLYTEDPGAEVRVLALVNGVTFEYPSVGDIRWMTVGPTMSLKRVKLLAAPEYEVSFEMEVRKGPSLSTRHLSQSVEYIRKLPHTDRYQLHQVKDLTRAAAISAEVAFELSTVP